LEGWAVAIPRNPNNKPSVFVESTQKLDKLTQSNNLNESQLSNPLEAKKLVFNPIFMDFKDSESAPAYFSMVLSVNKFKIIRKFNHLYRVLTRCKTSSKNALVLIQ
jgi:hypothetical protein